jgi:Flp pilus assembly protein TadD
MSSLQRGWQLHQAGEYREAEVIYRQALLSPGQQANAWCYLGILFYDTGNYSDSLDAYEKAIALQPEFPVALSNCANTLSALERFEEAVASCDAALALKPDYATAWTNLGAVRTKLGQFDEAAHCFRKSLEVCPENNEPAHRNLGATFVRQGRFQEGSEHTARALQISPRNAEAHRNRAIIKLLQADFDEGWDEYEWRWQCSDLSLPPFDVPFYSGEPLQGKTLLLHAEQGLGDTLQFVRYGELAQRAGAHVVVQCQEPLCRLLQSYQFSDAVIPRGADLPNIDFHLPMMSAPRVFQTRLESIPGRTPYLMADPILQRRWADWLEQANGLRIGVVWQGSTQHHADNQRSFHLADLACLGRDDVTFIPLQVGAGREQLADAPADMHIMDPGERLDRDCGAFMDTAAIVSQLDLVICCDTAIAHLSGALDVPTWVALSISPDWRWLLDREDSPWYPSVRLFRQTILQQWDEVMSAMSAELGRVSTRIKPDPNSIRIEVGAGELLDKLAILEIKRQRIKDSAKLANVKIELEVLRQTQRYQLPLTEPLDAMFQELKQINGQLWEVEDKLRVLEKQGDFGARFIELARQVYVTNDRRAVVKRQINDSAGSRIVEEKSYTQ